MDASPREGREIIFFARTENRAVVCGATHSRSQGRHVSRRIKRAIILVNPEQLAVIKHRKLPGERVGNAIIFK